ncbi:hypothetical protein Leryth_026238 [Lithospermum erythrorhizon]|uniref:Antimicrobial response protein n=1 Tax=Lithospermum erythrorhizon TaxID=34254 RepID=A0AAV3RED2_LITER|nr:hypothetical protein Leryth_026238 [Lithospermum erythrorhizon]
MAEAIISFVLESLGNLQIQEAEFLHGVKSLAEQLQDELRRMQWFLKDVDAKQDEGERIHEWISQVQDLAYDAENLIETYAFKIASSRYGGSIGSLKRYACFFNERALRHRLRSDMESVTLRISSLTRCFHDYGIRSIMGNKKG